MGSEQVAPRALKTFVPLLLVLLSLGCSGRQTRANDAPGASSDACGLLLKGARIVDPAARTITAGDLFVRDGRIVPLSEAKPCARALALDGMWVLPGLVDLHVHSWGNPSPTDEKLDQDIGTTAVARLIPRAGVTALLDLGGSEDEILATRARLAREPNPPHAAFFAAGPVFLEMRPLLSGALRAIHKTGGARLVSGSDDARKQVRELAAKKPDVIKIIYTHESERGSMSRSTMRAIMSEAHKAGIKTVVHIGTWQDAREAIEAGASAITHLYDDEPIPRDLPALYAKHHVVSIPTMAVQCDAARIEAAPAFLDDPLLLAVTTPALRDAYRDRAHYSEHAQDWVDWQQDMCKSNDLPSLKALYNAGVTLLTGSDAGNLGVFEGYSLHRELALFVEAGVDPFTALAGATTAAGAFLGRHYGVHVGDEANLLVLTGDPVADIANTKRIAHVMVGGRVAF